MHATLRLAAAALLSIGTAVSASAAIRTDIVFVVDESGSMGNVQANLRTNIGTFASIISAGGVDATYALVGYGNNAIVPRLISNFTTPAAFATAAQGLVINGGTEPAFTAIAFALNGLDSQATTLSFRPNALKNIIILTDEPSNGDNCSLGRGCIAGVTPNAANVDALAKANTALINAVLTGTSTINSIGGLATDNGGAVFSLSDFGSSDPNRVDNFITGFASAKLQEIIDFCTLNPTDPACQPTTQVPEPATLALFGAGLLGLAAVRRRRDAA